jgi:hypothetical protein
MKKQNSKPEYSLFNLDIPMISLPLPPTTLSWVGGGLRHMDESHELNVHMMQLHSVFFWGLFIVWIKNTEISDFRARLSLSNFM